MGQKDRQVPGCPDTGKGLGVETPGQPLLRISGTQNTAPLRAWLRGVEHKDPRRTSRSVTGPASWAYRENRSQYSSDCPRFWPQQLPLPVLGKDVRSKSCLFPDSIWPWQSLACERPRLPATWARCRSSSKSGHTGPQELGDLTQSLWGPSSRGAPALLEGWSGQPPRPRVQASPRTRRWDPGEERSPSGFST